MDVLDKLQLSLTRSEADPRQIVVMTCGLAGAGKSTLTKAIVEKYPNYERLSIDAIIHAKHGIYEVDYPPEKYAEYMDEADAEYHAKFLELLEKGEKDIAFDRSLYDKADRDYYKKLAEEKGARWILVYFRPANKEVIWNRIQSRRAKDVNADSALVISRELLDQYWDGFDIPDGEGEVVVDITA
ncbi:hypothetical protein B0H66DRAFT_617860 [Apodospora peruviana]|uniref:ATP/GTP-binding protein n=1 Tax=Apodospora peruviana TaxID=516989 RepID=A0AAE0IKN4_9PEZI|nr:hypothetical protein B0H66DRAFT_617860 [Apodospora peruviana]